jgi:two-component system sensor histidine kinase DesK
MAAGPTAGTGREIVVNMSTESPDDPSGSAAPGPGLAPDSGPPPGLAGGVAPPGGPSGADTGGDMTSMWSWLRQAWPSPSPWPEVPKGSERLANWRARRWTLFSSPWLLYLAYPLGTVWREGSRPAAVAGTLLLVGFAAQYALLVPRALAAGSIRARYGVVLGMLLTIGLLIVPIGADGLGALVYVASAGIVLLSPRHSLPFAVLLAATGTFLPPLVEGSGTGPQWGTGASVLGAAFVGFGFITLVRSNAALRMAREEVARLAAEQERLRIARDMHDLLGHTLTTVTVKAQLARRLVYRDPGRAESELADVERLARQSLADVRAVVAGYREVSLAVELATAREVLAAAGMTVQMPQAVDDVPGELRELFGWAVREGVTNAVRHSRASRVRITVDGHAVEVVDDGTGARPPDAADGPGAAGVPRAAVRPGAGLSGLAERAARVGGRVEAGAVPGHGYRLRVEVPPELLTGREPGTRAAADAAGRSSCAG